MSDYSQPDFYRFNEDSIELAKYVTTKVLTASHILDLGAGCGVIGIEVARKLRPDSLTFLEVQEDFIPHLKKNVLSHVEGNTKTSIHQNSFSGWKHDGDYDLIVCNPPYFLPGHGRVSPDHRKHTCRTFMIDNWSKLLLLTKQCLSKKGRAYFVLRRDQNILSVIQKAKLDMFLNIVGRKELVFLELSRLNID